MEGKQYSNQGKKLVHPLLAMCCWAAVVLLAYGANSYRKHGGGTEREVSKLLEKAEKVKNEATPHEIGNLLSKAYSIAPNDPRVLLANALASAEHQYPEGAIFFELLSKHRALSYPEQLQKQRLNLLSGDFRGVEIAIQKLLPFLNTATDFNQAYLLLSSCAQKDHREDDSLLFLEKALQHNSTSQETRYQFGSQLWLTSQKSGSSQALKRALHLLGTLAREAPSRHFTKNYPELALSSLAENPLPSSASYLREYTSILEEKGGSTYQRFLSILFKISLGEKAPSITSLLADSEENLKPHQAFAKFSNRDQIQILHWMNRHGFAKIAVALLPSSLAAKNEQLCIARLTSLLQLKEWNHFSIDLEQPNLPLSQTQIELFRAISASASNNSSEIIEGHLQKSRDLALRENNPGFLVHAGRLAAQAELYDLASKLFTGALAYPNTKRMASYALVNLAKSTGNNSASIASHLETLLDDSKLIDSEKYCYHSLLAGQNIERARLLTAQQHNEHPKDRAWTLLHYFSKIRNGQKLSTQETNKVLSLEFSSIQHFQHLRLALLRQHLLEHSGIRSHLLQKPNLKMLDSLTQEEKRLYL